MEKMKMRKATRLDGIRIKVSSGLDKKTADEILENKKLPDQLRKSNRVPLHKNKEDIQDTTNYKVINLLTIILNQKRGLLSTN